VCPKAEERQEKEITKDKMYDPFSVVTLY